MLCANVGGKFFVTLGLIFSFHFLERIASEPASRTKLPITLRATKAMKLLALHPFQHAWHDCIVNQGCAKVNSATLPSSRPVVQSSALLSDFEPKLEPFLQSGDITKSLRLHTSGNGHPVDSRAIRQAVNAHALMRLPRRVRRLPPEPQNSPSAAFIDLSETSLPSDYLK